MEYKIKTIKAKMPTYWYANRIGEVFNVKDVVYNNDFKIKVLDEVGKFINKEDCEIVKDTPEFDMKKEKWFISTPTPEISKLVQEWLFEQGFEWHNGNDQVSFTDVKFLMNSPFKFVENGFCWTDEPKEKEIKLTFKTIIDSVEYPTVETEQDEAIRALEETIAKAAEQIKQLKGK